MVIYHHLHRFYLQMSDDQSFRQDTRVDILKTHKNKKKNVRNFEISVFRVEQ